MDKIEFMSETNKDDLINYQKEEIIRLKKFKNAALFLLRKGAKFDECNRKITCGNRVFSVGPDVIQSIITASHKF